MRPALPKTLWIAVMVGSLLAGCTSSAALPEKTSGTAANLLPAAGSTSGVPAGEAIPPPATTLQSQFLPALENQSTSAPTQMSETPPTSTPPSSRKEIKAGLEASDPHTAQLASGVVQLIEFFAFW